MIYFSGLSTKCKKPEEVLNSKTFIWVKKIDL